eukprot:CAMPEP_0182555994 /NCGR_PEP_ID=MMETSP1324-20130603/408_1 /TAXON_ID=236786 /ORGANISM="Florenciella sp., Strain RCC1587" /LENGTH=88 /DNA_ID=CAMNT_0024767809 /DNA_START=38 /DNA_END=301 /DNA_ORIENTATION=+
MAEASADLKLNVKQVAGEKTFEVTVPGNATVAELKAEVAKLQPELIVAAQRLIFRGKILKDADSVATYQLENGATVLLQVNRSALPGD